MARPSHAVPATEGGAHGSFTTLFAGNTLNSSIFMPASLPNTCSEGNYLQHRFDPGESTMNDMAHTNTLDDCNTIVDMSLRLVRFVMCVVAALVFAFGFALLTSNKKTLTYVHENELTFNETLSAKASSVVENYNTLFGYILFSGGKVFEVFCETLIFPTLATYLHNCSLYLGDQPARTHSLAKTRCIFWGLKTVMILMNVGFTSVYVGKTTLNPIAANPTSRRLTAPDELTVISTQLETPLAVESDADLLHSILRTSLTGFTVPFEFEDVCQAVVEQGNKSADQQWGMWADDVDATSVSFSYPSHAWNAVLSTSRSIKPTQTAEFFLRDQLDNNHKKNAIIGDWDSMELYSIFLQSIAKMGLARHSKGAVAPLSLEELTQVVADDLKTILPARAQMSDLSLRLEHRDVAEDVKFTTLSISAPIETDNMGATLCGASGCVYSTPTSVLAELHMQPQVSIASNEKDSNSALVYSVTSQYIMDLGTAEQAPHEVLMLSFSKLTWKLSPLYTRHNAACADDDEYHCLGLSLPLATENGVLLVGTEALSTQHAVQPVALVTVHPATIIDTSRSDNNALTSWHRLVSSTGKLMRPSSFECISLVDAYLTHLGSNNFYLDGHRTQDMLSAALFYLLQRGVPTSYADVSRRLAISAVMVSSGSGPDNGIVTAATTDIEVNVPTATALVTVAGCIFIVLMSMCVIYLPTPRVKLSPDTTPAAQYVQILTDDLYPDLVHKKRLRFANGDCLLFNEYVVDAIVLHAKRDQTKKIYL